MRLLISQNLEVCPDECFWDKTRLTALCIGALLASWVSKNAHASGLEANWVSDLVNGQVALFKAAAEISAFYLTIFGLL